MVKRSCLHCGKTFEVSYPSSKRVNCSEKCRVARLNLPTRKRRSDTGQRKSEWVELECPVCGKQFELPPHQAEKQQHCSVSCAKKAITGRPPRNETKRYVTKDGYVMIGLPRDELMPGQPKNRYYGEHRVVMAKALGRWLEPQETVHHINGDKADNRIENLQLRHGNHGKGEALRCRVCGSHDLEPVPIDD